MKLLYKNISNSAKTFYGVTFQPGETKEVSGYINQSYMIRVDEAPATPKPKPVPTTAAPKIAPKTQQKPAETVPEKVLADSETK